MEATLTPCPACQNPVSAGADSCPKCGHKLKEKQTATGVLAAVVLGIIGGAAVIYLASLN